MCSTYPTFPYVDKIMIILISHISIQVPEDYIKLSPRLFMSDCEIASAYGQTTLDTVDYLVKQADIMNRSGTGERMGLFWKCLVDDNSVKK